MSKQDMLKIQTCVLRVNIHCDGCKDKVKKKLRKIKGVSKVNIDVEQGKVTVLGNVDPAILMNKLEKAGKHAELWGPQKGQFSVMNNQFFKNIQIEKTNGGKDTKTLKGLKDQHKGGFQVPVQMMHQNKGSKDVRFLGKEQHSVKFKLPQHNEDDDDDDFDESDEDDDEFDDEFDEGFAAHQSHSKVEPFAKGHNGHKAKKASPKGSKNGHENGKKGGGGMSMLLKGMFGKKAGGGNIDNVGKSHNMAGKNHNEGGKNSGKNGKFVAGEGKNGKTNGKGGGGGKNNDGWSKKGGENFDRGPKSDKKQHDRFNEMNEDHREGGRITVPIGQVGDFQAMQRPVAMNNNMGHFGGGPGQGIHPAYNQQQMAHMMMMMNQNQQRHDGAFQPSMYARPQPAMNYGPPPMAANDQYTHIFSDENTDSCSIM
ncbi:hypothetical protein DH2020_026875 [Rehmannia glutinosa]|uniref:HMA domain-containing protein n=1 Tax=Rehmannia glutinosa TaxID=99300 RepID=A0ABR0VVN2_REHGL